jgi:hypothetical protein
MKLKVLKSFSFALASIFILNTAIPLHAGEITNVREVSGEFLITVGPQKHAEMIGLENMNEPPVRRSYDEIDRLWEQTSAIVAATPPTEE